MRAIAQQRAERIPRRRLAGAEGPRVGRRDAIGDCVVPKLVPATVPPIVHGDVGNLDRGAKVEGHAGVVGRR